MKKREVKFELLRILCMYMIVIGHCLFHGRVTAKLGYGTVNYFLSYFIQSFSVVHVNCFVMIGGYLSFQGIQARGAYKNTPVEELLPVELLVGDDRVEKSGGVRPEVVCPDHPALRGIAGEWPMLLGYNKLLPKPGSEVPVTVNGDPLIVLGRYGKGRACAFATDCAPHWAPAAFCEWEGYAQLWKNLVDCLTD